MSMSVGVRMGSMTRGVSAEVGTVSRAGSSNQASTGSVSVTLLGQGFGVESWSRAAGLGATVCEMSRWTSGTAIVCRAAQEVRGSRASQVTVGMVAGSCTAGYSVGGGRVSVPVQGNAGTTGAASVTIRGGGFGLSFFSGSVWTGQTSCESTWWLGDTFVLCHGANGVGQSRRVWTTVGMRVGSLTRAMSWDRVTASALSSNNRMVTGSGQVTVFGARMGRSMTCMPLRIFGTAAEQTVWASDTCLEVLSGQGWLRSGRVGMTVGEHMASTSRSFSYVAYVMNVVLPGNVVGSGSSVITVLGAGMGLVDGTAKTRVGVTACEVTGWMSQTAMRCLLGDSFRGSLKGSLTLGARVGSGTNAYSGGSGMVSVAKRANTPVTGTVVVSVTGSNMKAVGLSGGGRAWQSGFEVSTWVSDSCVRAQAGSAVGRSQRMSVTTGTRVGSVTRGFSSDRAAGSAVRRSNVATTGSLMLSLQGTRLGAFDTSWAARLSRSSCERSVWDSDTSVRVRTGDSVQGSRRVVLTSGRVVGSMSRGVSAEKGRMSLVTACNAGSTGSASMTVHGAGLGRGSFTSAFRFGKTSCRVTGWISDSGVVCNSPAASLASRRVSVSVGVNVGTRSGGLSMMTGRVSEILRRNVVSTGSIFVSILGSGFGIYAFTGAITGGVSSAEMSNWRSDTAMLLRSAAGFSDSLRALITVDRGMSSASEGFSFVMGAGSLSHLWNVAKTGSVMVSLYGSGMSKADMSKKGRLGNTACEQTGWSSDSGLQCRSVAASSSSSRVSISGGYEICSLSRTVSFDVASLSSLLRFNTASSGSLFVTVLGAKHGQLVFSARVALGNSGCERSSWVSTSSLVCQAGHGQRKSSRVTLSIGQRHESLTALLSQDTVYVSGARRSNLVGLGSSMITLNGRGTGSELSSIGGRVGRTACGFSTWTSDTAVLCLTGQGRLNSWRFSVTVQRVLGSFSAAFSRDSSVEMTGASTNSERTGSASLTLVGAGLGVYSQSGLSKVGWSSASGSQWTSDTSLACKMTQGSTGSRGVMVSSGYSLGSLSLSLSVESAEISTVRRGNAPATGAIMTTISGSGLGLSGQTASVTIGISACEETSWGSDSVVVCKIGRDMVRSNSVVLTTGQRFGSTSLAFCVDYAKISAVIIRNMASTGSASITVSGKNVQLAASLALRSGGTAVEATSWLSGSSIRCNIHDQITSSQRILITTSTITNSATIGLSTETSCLSLIRMRNIPSTGSATISIQGADFAKKLISAAARLSRSSCERSVWDSDTSVRVRTGDSVQGSRRVVLTSGRVVGSMSRGVSAEKGRMSLVTACNAGSTGSASMTVHGAGLGRGSFTSAFRFGKTSCRVTGWISDSVVVCNSPAASLASRRVSVSVGVNVVTTTRGFSVEIAYLSIAVQHNTAASGSFSLTLLGAGFSFIAQSCLSRLGRSSASRSWWASDTALSVKETQGLLGSKVVLVTSGILVASLTNGFTFNMLSASGISGSNGPASGDYSLSVAGLNFGANRCQIILLI